MQESLAKFPLKVLEGLVVFSAPVPPGAKVPPLEDLKLIVESAGEFPRLKQGGCAILAYSGFLLNRHDRTSVSGDMSAVCVSRCKRFLFGLCAGGRWAGTAAALKKAGSKGLIVACPEALAADPALAAEVKAAQGATASGAAVTPACILDAVLRKRLAFDDYFVEPAAPSKRKR
jgi:hypothetical protein